MDIDDCEHDFAKGICKNCGQECEHQEIDDGHCLDCGEFVLREVEPDDDWLENQKDRI